MGKKAFIKIGFHTAVGGNPTGIGDHLTRLDQANIPFFIKAVDGMTGVYDAQNIMRTSSTPHTAVYRRSVPYAGATPGYNPDVPNYNADPKTAALTHWAYHKQGLPPELDKNLVWIETINEVRKEVKWADWLGNFALETAKAMNADGYKFSAFGFSAGTPEPEAWETEGMLDYLRYCATHPDQAAVALHEYSFKVDDIWYLKNYHIGRFEQLFSTCDKHNIKRPNVLITEWGWTYDDVPKTNRAMDDILAVAEYYAQFPEILGAAIWYLGPGFGGIANKTQPLIGPLTDLTLTTEFDITQPPAPTETLFDFLQRIAEDNRKIDYNTLAALEKTIVKDGLVPYGDECWASFENQQYAIQGARRLGIEPPERRIYYTTVGDWDNVMWIPEKPTTTVPLVINDIVDSLPKHAVNIYKTRNITDITTITIHHTVGVTSIKNIANYHVNTRGWPGIGYHYVIKQDGSVYKTNNLSTISYHAGVVGEQNNNYALGIAMIGDFTSKSPTQAQLKAIKQLVEYLQTDLSRAKYILPHKLMPRQTTSCPGNSLLSWFNQIVIPIPTKQPVSIKFVPFDTVSVVNAKFLNVRKTPSGEIIGTVNTGDRGIVQPHTPKNVNGSDWWQIQYANFTGWCAERYLQIDLKLPPSQPTVNLLDYIKGDGVLYEVKNADGGQERFQTQIIPNGFLQTKNSLAEKFFVKDGYIYRDWDTSPGNNRFYKLLENDIAGSRWIPLQMTIGESYTRARKVQFYNWDCTPSDINSGDVVDTMKFVAKYNSYTFETGITLNDVIELEWVNGQEKYFYARRYGLVGWARQHQDINTPQWSAISEIHAPGQRPDNEVNLPHCLPLFSIDGLDFFLPKI